MPNVPGKIDVVLLTGHEIGNSVSESLRLMGISADYADNAARASELIPRARVVVVTLCNHWSNRWLPSVIASIPTETPKIAFICCAYPADLSGYVGSAEISEQPGVLIETIKTALARKGDS